MSQPPVAPWGRPSAPGSTPPQWGAPTGQQPWTPPSNQPWGQPAGQQPWGQAYPPGPRPQPPAAPGVHATGWGVQPGRPLPPQPPRKPSKAPWVVVAVALTVAVVLVGAGLLQPKQRTGTPVVTVTSVHTRSASPKPTPTTATPTPTPTQPPTSAPTTTSNPPSRQGPLPENPGWDKLPKPHSKHPVWVKLQQNKLYAHQLPATKCPTIPDGIASNAAFKKLVLAIIECQYRQWKPVFDKMGMSFVKPQVVFFSGTVNSPCGKKNGVKVSFYCWQGRNFHTIYMHTALITESNQWWRLRVAETTVHEFFHHVQHQAGIMKAEWDLTQSGANAKENSRRIELQTACVTARLLVQTPSFGFERSDYDTMRRWFAKGQDAWHGNAKSNTYWGTRGFYSPTVGGCNTWLVHASRVA